MQGQSDPSRVGISGTSRGQTVSESGVVESCCGAVKKTLTVRMAEERQHARTRRADGEPCLDAQRMQLYDRRAEEVMLDEVDRLSI